MKKTIEPKYIIEGKRNGFWEVIMTSQRKDLNLENEREQFNNSLLKGGANEHLGLKYRIWDVRLRTNKKAFDIVSEYTAPMFEIF